jgi:hypothetical protein
MPTPRLVLRFKDSNICNVVLIFLSLISLLTPQGKSTVLKQVKKLHKGFTDKDRNHAHVSIVNQLIRTLRGLIDIGVEKGKDYVRDSKIAKLYEQLAPIEEVPYELNKEDFEKLLQEIGDICVPMWGLLSKYEFVYVFLKDEGGDDSKANTVTTNNARPDFQMVEYFLKKIDSIFKSGYIITDDDIINFRRETHGFQTLAFKIEYGGKTQDFLLTDVGGQVHERYSWVTQYKGTLAVLFMISLSEYNESFLSRGTDAAAGTKPTNLNRLTHSIELLNDVMNEKALKDSLFVVLLNKVDMFQTKLKTIDIRAFDPKADATKATDMKYGLELIKNHMKETVGAEKYSKISIYVTCAADTHLFKGVFESIANKLLEKNLEDFEM